MWTTVSPTKKMVEFGALPASPSSPPSKEEEPLKRGAAPAPQWKEDASMMRRGMAAWEQRGITRLIHRLPGVAMLNTLKEGKSQNQSNAI